MGHLDITEGKSDVLDKMQWLIFSDMVHAPAQSQRPYDEIRDAAMLRVRLEDFLEQMNMLSLVRMELVMFDYAILHCARIARILKIPARRAGGSGALLVGVRGSGRRSCTKLASYMADYEIFTSNASTSRQYSDTVWKDDMKRLLTSCGGKGEHCTFIVSDTVELSHESCIEDIANLLKCGDLASSTLWNSAEDKAEVLDEVCQAIQHEVTTGTELTPSYLYARFVARCKQHLHLVLCMSPLGSSFRAHLHACPSLLDCSTVDWHTPWPVKALQQVATPVIDDAGLGRNCVTVSHLLHTAVTDAVELENVTIYATPVQFLEHVATFKRLYTEKKNRTNESIADCNVVLQKVLAAEKDVASMGKELGAMKPKLMQKRKDTQQLLAELAEETEEMEKMRLFIAKEEPHCDELTKTAKTVKAQYDEDMANPVRDLDQATQRVASLRSQDREELINVTPTPGIRSMMHAVCLLAGVNPVDKKTDICNAWGAGQKLLADGLGFVRTFDKDNVPADVLKQVAEITADKDCDPTLMAETSNTVDTILSWVRAVEAYAVAHATAHDEVHTADKHRQEASTALLDKREQLSSMEAEYEDRRIKHDATQKDANLLQQSVDECERKFESADMLVSCLAEETKRWQKRVERLARLRKKVYFTPK